MKNIKTDEQRSQQDELNEGDKSHEVGALEKMENI